MNKSPEEGRNEEMKTGRKDGREKSNPARKEGRMDGWKQAKQKEC